MIHTIYRYLDTIFHTVSQTYCIHNIDTNIHIRHILYTDIWTQYFIPYPKHTAYTIFIPISISDTYYIYRYLDTIFHTVSQTHCIHNVDTNIHPIVLKHYRAPGIETRYPVSKYLDTKTPILYPNILHTCIEYNILTLYSNIKHKYSVRYRIQM